MTGTHLQTVPGGDGPVQPWAENSAQMGWDEPQVEAPNRGVQQLQRYLSALNRFKWLIALLLVIGAVGGVLATRFIVPEYEVQATVVLGGGPPQPGQNDAMRAASSIDLLQAYAVVDPVVAQLRLFLQPAAAGDSTLFGDFRIGTAVRAGQYTMRITGNEYQLVLNGTAPVESGKLGDPVGRLVGFEWQPPASVFGGRKTVDFTVRTPREASVELLRRLRPTLSTGSNLLRLRLTGSDAQRTANTLNAWTESFVAAATQQKRSGVVQTAFVLEGQLEYAQQELTAAENALQGFRVSTATLPSESKIPQIAGAELLRDPIFSAYFDQKITSDNLARDRTAITRALTSGPNGGVSPEGLLAVPIINSDPASARLRARITELFEKETNLRTLRQRYTDENKIIVDLVASIDAVREVELPAATRAFLTELERRGELIEGRLEDQQVDLRAIPSRTIEETRLRRQVEVADQSYRTLLTAARQARVSESTTSAEISVLDSAVAPIKPTKNTAPVMIFGAIVAALGLGIALAIALDLLDKRFRYPQQATDELGLFILGVIPEIDRKRKRRSAESSAQMVEAFRSIRMNLRYAVDPTRPFACTISSPGPNDGKSLVASNLALSFADGGARVLLIDGDVRRGGLHEVFKADARPGLTDYLEGTALLPEVLRSTSHANVTLMPCGRRQRRAPELLTGPRLTQLITQLQREYDVVLVDSPPLGAGADAYTLGIACGHMVMVLRAGHTDRKMASAKLRTVETLPMRVLGGVLNGIQMTGVYQYYSYYLDYDAKDEDNARALPSKPRSSEVVVKAAGD